MKTLRKWIVTDPYFLKVEKLIEKSTSENGYPSSFVSMKTNYKPVEVHFCSN